MTNFHFRQRVEIYVYGEKKIPFERCYINDKGDKLNDPDVLQISIYSNNGRFSRLAYYPR